MRIRPAPASPLYPKLRFALTDHPITVWAGTILLRLYFELIGSRAALGPLLVSFGEDVQQSDSRRGRPAGLVVWIGAGCQTV